MIAGKDIKARFFGAREWGEVLLLTNKHYFLRMESIP
jgi:hypothetical protein